MTTNLYGFIKTSGVRSNIIGESLKEAIVPAIIGAGGGALGGYFLGDKANPYKGTQDTRLRNALIGAGIGGLGLGGLSTYLNKRGIEKGIYHTLKGTKPIDQVTASVLNTSEI